MDVTFKSNSVKKVTVDGVSHQTNQRVTTNKEFVATIREQFPDIHVTEHKGGDSGGDAGNQSGNGESSGSGE